MARGGSSIFVSLVVIFLGFLLLFTLLRAVILYFFPSGLGQGLEEDLLRQVYVIFLAMTDPGNMAQDTDSSIWFKFSTVLAGLAGVIIFSGLIAFVTTSLDQLLLSLKKGHSRVIEEKHTLILGWNERIVEILHELITANESEKDACVVIMADRDKEEMDDFLSVYVPESRSTRIVTRSGGSSSLVNLALVAVDTCKSVIVLAHCNDSASATEKAASDARVIKTLLGLHAIKTGEEGEPPLNIVAEIFRKRNRQIAREISLGIAAVNSEEILAKILVQTSRSVGLSVVYSEIMSFDGCEMYFHHADWAGRTFGQIQFFYPDGVPMGVRTGTGEVILNPPAHRTLEAEDRLLILAEDDSSISLTGQPVATPKPLALRDHRCSKGVERELIIGWNSRVPCVLREYADYVQEGSCIDLLLKKPPEEVRKVIQLLRKRLPNVRIRLIDGDPMNPSTLMAVKPFSYDNVIVMSHGDVSNDPEGIDSETIVILLLLRNIFDKQALDSMVCETKLISEVLDSGNRELVARAGVNDFIISNRIVSKLLAQISEEADIYRVYQHLFSEQGSEIYLKFVSTYMEDLPQEVTFADLMGLAQKRGEVCLGIKVKAEEHNLEQNFGVQLIPEKNTLFHLEPRDSLIVLAEDET
jgi:hypothetical protein